MVNTIEKSGFNTNQSMSHAEMKNHVSNVYYKSSVEKEDLFHEFRLWQRAIAVGNVIKRVFMCCIYWLRVIYPSLEWEKGVQITPKVSSI